ncbi:MAG: transporter substrate-binding domain-containing protein [Campylobacteraceae bacterium]|nr:transporter substrate-binding domain-containing protein [Campylobacteraceae bacterium]
MKNILFLAFIILSFLHSRSLDEILEKNNIIIAVYENFPPYSYIENGMKKGIDIDIAKKIAKKMKVNITWYWTGSDENLEDDLRNVIWKGHLIHKTKADVMFRIPFDYDFIRQTDKSTGELSNELVVMKSPYHAERWVIVTNKKVIKEFKSLAIFKYHKIGVEIDTLPDSYLSSSFRGSLSSNVKHYRSIFTAIKDLKDGKIAAVAGLKSQLQYALDYNNNKDKYFMSEKIPYTRSIWDLGLAVRTDFRALSYELDGHMSDLYKSGEIQKIFEKYNVVYEKPLVYQNY